MTNCKECGKKLSLKERLGTRMARSTLVGVGDKDSLKTLCGQCLGKFLEAFKK